MRPAETVGSGHFLSAKAVAQLHAYGATAFHNGGMNHAAEPAISAASRPLPQARGAYAVFRDVATRWADNDVYGHVNNVVYYSWFDTTVNTYLMEQGALDIHHGSTIGLVIESHCNYFAPLAYPQVVQVGMRVGKLGSSSVRYEIGVFAKGQMQCAAAGHFVHVYVDKTTRRPCALPAALRLALEPLVLAGAT